MNDLKIFLDLDVEICGFIIGKEFYIDNVGNSNDSRRSCKHKYYLSQIFHTHPYTSKAYPSTEDIIKVLKNDKIYLSYVITSWGIYGIYFSFKEKDKNTLNILSKEITKINDDLYFKTDKGRGKFNEDKILSYIKELESLLRNYQARIIFKKYL